MFYGSLVSAKGHRKVQTEGLLFTMWIKSPTTNQVCPYLFSYDRLYVKMCNAHELGFSTSSKDSDKNLTDFSYSSRTSFSKHPYCKYSNSNKGKKKVRNFVRASHQKRVTVCQKKINVNLLVPHLIPLKRFWIKRTKILGILLFLEGQMKRKPLGQNLLS